MVIQKNMHEIPAYNIKEEFESAINMEMDNMWHVYHKPF